MRNIDDVVSIYWISDYRLKYLGVVRAGHKDEIIRRISPHDIDPRLHILPDAEPVIDVGVIKNPVAVRSFIGSLKSSKRTCESLANLGAIYSQNWLVESTWSYVLAT